MFGGNFWGSPIFGGVDDHLSRERDPPPRPTRLEFPDYVPPYNPRPLTRKLSAQLQHKICHSKSYLDISEADVESLNVHFQKDVSLSSMVPDDQYAERPFLFDNDLQAMLDEVSIENEHAFREVLRLPPLQGRKKPRLAYARNFFGSLEDIARYFDDSKDNYYRIPANAKSKSSETKEETQSNGSNQKDEMRNNISENTSENNSDTKEVYTGYRISSAEALSPGTRLALLKNLLKTTMHKFQCRDHEPIPQPREKLVFRGIKIQSIQYQFCVARMPQDIRLARARKVEGPIMAVMARDDLRFKEKNSLQSGERIPFVGERFDLFREIGCLLILASQRSRSLQNESTSSTGDVEKWWACKQRWGGGPTRWGQLASEVYEDEDPSWSVEERRLREEKRQQTEANTESTNVNDGKIDPKSLEIDDLLANNGKSTSDSTTKAKSLPGIPAGSKPATAPSTTIKPITPTEVDLRPKRRKLRSMERPPGDTPATHDGRRIMYVPPFKQKWYQEWVKMRPPTPSFDDKIISKRIGSATGDEFDEVFMLTSVNHHMALVKMRVHPDYLRWVENGTDVIAGSNADKERKDVLYVRRTVWFDMLKVQDRQEFLIGLWRVFCWLNRECVPEAERAKMRSLQEQRNTDSMDP